MSHELSDQEMLVAPELHADVVELDGKIVQLLKEEGMSDAEKEALNALIEQRNEAYTLNHKVAQDKSADASD